MNRTDVRAMVKRLHQLADDSAQTTFETCQILHAFRTSKLYEVIDFDSFSDFVEGSDLGMGYGMATKYVSFYDKSRELGYRKAETLELIRALGIMQGLRMLTRATRKVAVSTLVRWSAEYYKNNRVMTFTLDRDQQERIDALLLDHGMEMHESGYRSGAAKALVHALGLADKPKLRAVK